MDAGWLDRISPCLRRAPTGARVPSYTNHANAAPGWVTAPRVIYDHELILFSRGEFVATIDEREYPCPSDTFIILPPGRPHALWLLGDRAGYHYYAHFDWVCQGPVGDTPIMTYRPAQPRPSRYRLAPDFVPKRVLHGPIRSPQRAYDLAERVVNLSVHGTEHERVTSRALLLGLLLELLDESDRRRSSPAQERTLAQEVRLVLNRVAAEAHPLPSMRSLLEQLGRSYEHLCRLFRARYGIPPLKYVHAQRIARAKLLLRDTGLSIAEVARHLGFRDAAYFSRVFRKMTGLSPSHFARMR